MTHVIVTNAARRVNDSDIATATAAVARQAVRDFWPAWGVRMPSVTFVPGGQSVAAPFGGILITVVDSIDNVAAGVLGYHTEDQGGRQWGVVACSPSLDNGAQVLKGDWSVSSVLSHEILEALGDPRVNGYCHDGGSRLYSLEVCDPVEAPTYEVDGVSLSNFVLPAWFDPNVGHGKYDHLGLLSTPFSLLPAGYCVYLQGGQEQQEHGEQMPGWRLHMKEAQSSRIQRRHRVLAGQP